MDSTILNFEPSPQRMIHPNCFPHGSPHVTGAHPLNAINNQGIPENCIPTVLICSKTEGKLKTQNNFFYNRKCKVTEGFKIWKIINITATEIR